MEELVEVQAVLAVLAVLVDQVALVQVQAVQAPELELPDNLRCLSKSLRSLLCKDHQILHRGNLRKNYHRPICSNSIWDRLRLPQSSQRKILSTS